jgi:hypothetical protein
MSPLRKTIHLTKLEVKILVLDLLSIYFLGNPKCILWDKGGWDNVPSLTTLIF